jgi:hypothetical protein
LADDLVGQGEGRRLVALDQGLEGGDLTGAGPVHEGGIARRL